MLQTAPKFTSVNELRANMKNVFDAAKAAPTLVMNRSTPEIYLVSVEQWDRIVEQLEEKDDIIELLEAQLDVACGNDTLIDVDIAKLEAMAGL